MAFRSTPLVVGLVALLACLPLHEASATKPAHDVILVHGAWCDASSWSSVIGILQSQNYTVHAVQLCLKDLTEDVAVVRQAVINTGRPVVLVGHSLGGVYITIASAGLKNVSALVYVAAYAPDKGENVLSLSAKFKPPPLFPYILADKQGYTTLEPTAFVKLFSSGVKPATARILLAVQKPTFGGIFGTNVTVTPGWATIPSYFAVSKNDQAINPDLEAFVAKRAKPVETLVLKSGHLSLVSHPEEVAGLIVRATKGTTKPKATRRALRHRTRHVTAAK